MLAACELLGDPLVSTLTFSLAPEALWLQMFPATPLAPPES